MHVGLLSHEAWFVLDVHGVVWNVPNATTELTISDGNVPVLCPGGGMCRWGPNLARGQTEVGVDVYDHDTDFNLLSLSTSNSQPE